MSASARSRGLPPEPFAYLHEAMGAAAVLSTAERLGMLARLDAGPARAGELARECGIGERGARGLLAALTGLGLAEPTADGEYRAALPDLVRLYRLNALWSRLDEVVRDDRPDVAADTAAGAGVLYPDSVFYLAAFLAEAAEAAAEALLQRLGTGARILDCGAGGAPWSIALALRDPSARVVAVDLPAVLPATRQAVAAVGVAGQFEYLPGDMFSVGWGESAYDLAIAGNVCHLFGEAANRHFLARLAHAVRPGGAVAILDVLPNERMDGPRWVMLYALGLQLRTHSGQVYPFSTYMSWLRAVGLESIERVDLPGSLPISLVIAQRPVTS